MTEKWRPALIPGVQGGYEVSDQGRFRNARTRQLRRPQRVQGRNYIGVRLIGVKHPRLFLVAGLVAKAFLRPPLPGELIEHKNQHKTDDRADNLAWMTLSQNIQRSYQLSDRLQRDAHKNRICNRFLSEQAHELVKKLWPAHSQVRIGRAVGLDNSTVSLIVRGIIKPRENGYQNLTVNWEALSLSK